VLAGGTTAWRHAAGVLTLVLSFRKGLVFTFKLHRLLCSGVSFRFLARLGIGIALLGPRATHGATMLC
jgi:hypothetical protein